MTPLSRRALPGTLCLLSWLGCTPAAPPTPPAPLPVASAPPPPVQVAAPPPASVCRVDGLGTPFVGPADPSWGNPDAPVTVVVFDEFDHIFARRLERSLARLRERFGPDRLRIVWKNNPLEFHPHALSSALVGQAVYAQKGPDAFWRYRSSLLQVGSDSGVSLTPEDIVRAAASAGLDGAAVERALQDPTVKAKIEDDLAQVRELHINGAPHSFVNGHEITGAQPAEAFEPIIATELAAAEAAPSPEGLSCQATRHTLATRPPPPEPMPAPAPAEDNSIWNIPIGASPTRGPATALVTIVEFGDYQDPFSHRVEPTLRELRQQYGERLRIVWKDQPLPFHPLASPAAKVAREIRARRGLDAFWVAHDQLFDARLSDERIAEVAAAFGLDAAATRRVIASHKHEKEIDVDHGLAEDAKASGTPHFFINGQRLVGAQPVEAFRKVIDEQMKRAEAQLAQGTAPAALYDTLVGQGKTAEPLERLEVEPPPPGAPVRGSAGARVVIQEFGSFEDRFTARVDPTLQELLTLYKGRVKIVWREFPLPMFKDAPLAGEAAAEARAQRGPDGFWKMYDVLLAHQKDEGGLKQPALETYAQQLGLDLTRFRQALADHRHAPAREADVAAAGRARITATPTFSINGYRVSGAQSTRVFRKVIDQALADLAPPSAAATKK